MNPVLDWEIKGVLQSDSLDPWNIYLRVYSQINFISQHSYFSQGRKYGIFLRITVKNVHFFFQLTTYKETLRCVKKNVL